MKYELATYARDFDLDRCYSEQIALRKRRREVETDIGEIKRQIREGGRDEDWERRAVDARRFKRREVDDLATKYQMVQARIKLLHEADYAVSRDREYREFVAIARLRAGDDFVQSIFDKINSDRVPRRPLSDSGDSAHGNDQARPRT